MPSEEMEEVGEQEGGGWDVDEELELPPDLVRLVRDHCCWSCALRC